MLLARFAESLYWAGRYLERAEATSRLIKVHSELLLDLPRAAGVGWSPLLAVTGSGEEFLGRHAGPDEESVVAFLATDSKNQGAILSSLAQARHNLRGSRVVLPSSSWEVVNDLHGWATASASAAISRRTRLRWMENVICDCQLLAGLLEGTMCDDEVYAFLQLGRYLERADMTTRVLDVQAGVLVDQAGDGAPYRDVTWMSVLRSLCADQMFLRIRRRGVSGPSALRFLLHDTQFPRSVEFCLSAAARFLDKVPRAEDPLANVVELRTRLHDVAISDLATPDDLHECVDDLQTGTAGLHDVLADTYFRPDPASMTSARA